MTQADEQKIILEWLEGLRVEHTDLDAVVNHLLEARHHDSMRIQRLKRRKLKRLKPSDNGKIGNVFNAGIISSLRSEALGVEDRGLFALMAKLVGVQFQFVIGQPRGVACREGQAIATAQDAGLARG